MLPYTGVVTVTRGADAGHRAFSISCSVEKCGSTTGDDLVLVLGPACRLKGEVTVEGFSLRPRQECTVVLDGSQIAFSVVAGGGPLPDAEDPLRVEVTGQSLNSVSGGKQEPLALRIVASQSGAATDLAACGQ